MKVYPFECSADEVPGEIVARDEKNKPRYVVHFTGRGYTAPDRHNPNGVRVTGSGSIVVDGERPARSRDIPSAVWVQCKEFFMRECRCVRYDGDVPGETHYPTLRLGKALGGKAHGQARTNTDEHKGKEGV